MGALRGWSFMRNILCTLVMAVAVGSSPAAARDDRPFSERFLYGGEIVGTFAPKDRGYFNELEYERNLLRLIRFNFALELQASERFSVLTEIRTDNFDVPKPYALYVRIRPWLDRELDVQVGRIPPVFGQFARRRYSIDNPLIGYPLLYQYPSTTRADAAPRALDQVLDQRGRGSRVYYPIGNAELHAGLPIVNPLQWDTGVQVVVGRDPLTFAAALTQGTIANPRVRDDNTGKQVAARVGARPAFGLELGLSAARGEYVADDVSSVAGESGDQTAFGADVEMSRNHLIVRAEAIWSRWDAPTLDTRSLSAFGYYVEASYKISPGLYVAARADRIRYADVAGAAGATAWDASVTRFEAGVGYYFFRQLLAKVVYQYNEREAGAPRVRHFPAVQISFWF